MRTQALALVLTISSSLFAQVPDATEGVFQAALSLADDHVHAVHNVEMQALPSSAFAVARRTIGGAPEAYRNFAQAQFGSVIAAELIDAYGASGPAVRLVDEEAVGEFRVLSLEQFEAGAYDYDWQRLNQEYPDVRYVLRVSSPLVDRQGAYAVVRYEVIGPKGPEFATMTKFEKQNDNEWKGLMHEVGDVWK